MALSNNTWPDAGNSPFRSEIKVTNWEGAYRVPAMIRWPGHIKPDTISGNYYREWMTGY